jgi:hypothetical protein
MPGCVEAHLLLARTHLTGCRRDEAARHLVAVLRVAPTNVEAHLLSA